MSLPLTSNLTTCPHGQRGTTTCLYCRQEARVAARHRRNRTMAKVGLMTLAGGILAGLAVSALIAVVPRSRPNDSVSVSEPVRLSAKASRRGAKAERVAKDTKAEHASKAPAPELVTAPRDTVAAPAEPSGAPREIPATPVIAEGRTEFGEGVFAERTGAEVTVHFDTDDL